MISYSLLAVSLPALVLLPFPTFFLRNTSSFYGVLKFTDKLTHYKIISWISWPYLLGTAIIAIYLFVRFFGVYFPSKLLKFLWFLLTNLKNLDKSFLLSHKHIILLWLLELNAFKLTTISLYTVEFRILKVVYFMLFTSKSETLSCFSRLYE